MDRTGVGWYTGGCGVGSVLDWTSSEVRVGIVLGIEIGY